MGKFLEEMNKLGEAIIVSETNDKDKLQLNSVGSFDSGVIKNRIMKVKLDEAQLKQIIDAILELKDNKN